MNKFLGIFGKLFAFIPNVVMQVETLAGQQTGETKKAAALGMVTSAAEIAGAVEGVDVSAAAPALNSGIAIAIDATVGLFNALGIFKHKAAASPSPSPAPAPAPVIQIPSATHAPAQAAAAPAPQAVHGTPSTL